MIKGRTVNLRLVRFNDLSFLLKWWQDKDLMRFYDRLPVSSPLELGDELRARIDSRDRVDFIIETKAEQPIGLAYLQNINQRHRHCEIHIMVGERRAGLAYAGAEAAFHVLHYAFHQLNIHRVYSRIMEFASEADHLMRSAGFTKEAVLRRASFQKGRSWEIHVYGILAEEYRAFLRSPLGERLQRRFACESSRLAKSARMGDAQRVPIAEPIEAGSAIQA